MNKYHKSILKSVAHDITSAATIGDYIGCYIVYINTEEDYPCILSWNGPFFALCNFAQNMKVIVWREFRDNF